MGYDMRFIEQSELPATPYVYGLVEPNGNVFYVGKARGDRPFRHFHFAKTGSSLPYHRLIRKIWANDENVRVAVLHEAMSDDETLDMERQIAEQLSAEGHVLRNLKPCGRGGRGGNISDAHREKIRAGVRARYQDPELRKKIGEAVKASGKVGHPKGLALTDEHKRNIGEAVKKWKAELTPEQRALTEEHKAKISATRTGKTYGPKPSQSSAMSRYWAKVRSGEIERPCRAKNSLEKS